MDYSFLIHLSVGGHLGCFCVLAVVNNAAGNMAYRYLFESCFTTSEKYSSPPVSEGCAPCGYLTG